MGWCTVQKVHRVPFVPEIGFICVHLHLASSGVGSNQGHLGFYYGHGETRLISNNVDSLDVELGCKVRKEHP